MSALVGIIGALPGLVTVGVIIVIVVVAVKVFRSITGVFGALKCDKGWQKEGVQCIKDPPEGYKRNKGDVTTYYLKDPGSYPIPVKPSHQDNSVCNGLKGVVEGIRTCTGTDLCAKKLQVCKSCSYYNYTWGCNKSRCGKTKLGTAKCCAKGIRTKVTAPNCKQCGVLRSQCIPEVKTRGTPPRTCEKGYDMGPADKLGIGMCYGNCREGYEKRPGDVVSCWSKKAPSMLIKPEWVKPAHKK